MKLLLCSVILIPVSFFSIAQDGDVEKISVIGSRIKRTDMEGPSPVLVIDREQIEKSGYSSLSDTLRDLPVALITRETSLNSHPSLTQVNIRGSDALVLVNGQRISPVGGGKEIDINLIPLSVIERVEILKDGASAIYGTDAVGGVINIITKRNYSGGQVNVQGNLVQRKEGNSISSFASFLDFWDWNRGDWSGKGDDLAVDASYGWNAENVNYLIGGQLRFNAPIYMRDRSFGRAKKDHFNEHSGWGSWRAVNPDGTPIGKWNPSPHCPKENISTDGQYCVYDFSEEMQFSPRILQGSTFFQTETDIGNTSLFSTAIYSYTKVFSALAPAPDNFSRPKLPGDKNYLVSGTVANQNWGLGVSADQVEAKYRLVYEKGGGPRKQFEDIHFYQVQSRANHPLGDTMDLEVDLNISGSHFLSNNENYFDKQKLFTMAKNKQFNPFASVDKKDDISSAAYEPWQRTHSYLMNLEPKVMGELLDINNSPVYFAVGGKGEWQMYSESIDSITLERGRQWGGGVAAEGSGDRWYGAVYGELSHTMFDMLEVQLATRTDYYSDFGLTEYELDMPFGEDSTFPLWTSPQLKLSFQPMDELKLRASWSMGFQAPALEDMYQNEITSHPDGIDRVRCPVYDSKKPNCKKKQHKSFLKSNKDLKPEKYQSVNLGFILEPVENFSIAMDYYRINEKDKIEKMDPSDLFLIEAEKGIGAVRKMNQDVHRVNGIVESDGHLIIRTANLASEKKRGIDLETNILVNNLGIPWDLTFKVEHNYLLYFERQPSTLSSKESPVPYPKWIEDTFGFESPDPQRNPDIPDPNNPKNENRQVTRETHPDSPRWQNRTTLGFLSKDKKYAFYLTAINIPPQLKTKLSKPKDSNNNLVDHTIDHYFQMDLMGVFALSKKSQLMVGIKNLWDAERPYNDQNFSPSGYISSALYSIDGRTIDVRYTYNF